VKITKKQSVFTATNGSRIEQGAWTLPTETMIRGEFRCKFPPGSRWGDGVCGDLAFFLGEKVESVRFLCSPNDIFDKGRPRYEDAKYNCIDFSGKFTSLENRGFGHHLEVLPTFDDGWNFSFSSAISRLGRFETMVSAEKIAADLVCSDSFEVAFGHLHMRSETQSAFQAALMIPLNDVEGLRLAFSDALGMAYLQRLLRMNGYETT
jgi:hypothetical protein